MTDKKYEWAKDNNQKGKLYEIFKHWLPPKNNMDQTNKWMDFSSNHHSHTNTLLWAFTWVKLKIFHPPSEEETSLELSIKQVLQGSSTNSPFDCFELPSSLPAVIFGFLVTSQKKKRAYNQFTWMTATATPNPKIISRFPLSKSSVLS